jgi:hypothetical protein
MISSKLYWLYKIFGQERSQISAQYQEQFKSKELFGDGSSGLEKWEVPLTRLMVPW